MDVRCLVQKLYWEKRFFRKWRCWCNKRRFFSNSDFFTLNYSIDDAIEVWARGLVKVSKNISWSMIEFTTIVLSFAEARPNFSLECWNWGIFAQNGLENTKNTQNQAISCFIAEVLLYLSAWKSAVSYVITSAIY